MPSTILVLNPGDVEVFDTTMRPHRRLSAADRHERHTAARAPPPSLDEQRGFLYRWGARLRDNPALRRVSSLGREASGTGVVTVPSREHEMGAPAARTPAAGGQC